MGWATFGPVEKPPSKFSGGIYDFDHGWPHAYDWRVRGLIQQESSAVKRTKSEGKIYWKLETLTKYGAKNKLRKLFTCDFNEKPQ